MKNKRFKFLLTSVSNQQLIFLPPVNCLYTQQTVVYLQFFYISNQFNHLRRTFSFKVTCLLQRLSLNINVLLKGPIVIQIRFLESNLLITSQVL